mmetsp:Transcript_15064/g.28307  ORF Transcript_15064/g.28307 Transcript_15064/m.28307 type:complete len:215 (+) Transcript_15064:213-857(+)
MGIVACLGQGNHGGIGDLRVVDADLLQGLFLDELGENASRSIRYSRVADVNAFQGGGRGGGCKERRQEPNAARVGDVLIAINIKALQAGRQGQDLPQGSGSSLSHLAMIKRQAFQLEVGRPLHNHGAEFLEARVPHVTLIARQALQVGEGRDHVGQLLRKARIGCVGRGVKFNLLQLCRSGFEDLGQDLRQPSSVPSTKPKHHRLELRRLREGC